MSNRDCCSSALLKNLRVKSRVSSNGGEGMTTNELFAFIVAMGIGLLVGILANIAYA